MESADPPSWAFSMAAAIDTSLSLECRLILYVLLEEAPHLPEVLKTEMAGEANNG
jgi:hypothetical protein